MASNKIQASSNQLNSTISADYSKVTVQQLVT